MDFLEDLVKVWHRVLWRWEKVKQQAVERPKRFQSTRP